MDIVLQSIDEKTNTDILPIKTQKQKITFKILLMCSQLSDIINIRHF